MDSWEEHLQRVRASELADLRWHWDGAYEFGWSDDHQFTATRTDSGAVITAPDAVALREAVCDDYTRQPVPRDSFDPPGE